MDVLPVLKELSAAGLPAERADTLRKKLALYLNELLLHDFAALVQLLYTVDVPEQKLKATLQEHPGEDAGLLMADVVIKRQQEKMEARHKFRFPTNESEEERW